METIVRKGEIASDKQFPLFSQCFLHYMALIFHFKCTVNGHLQFVSIWTSLKCCLDQSKMLSSGNGLKKGKEQGDFFSVLQTAQFEEQITLNACTHNDIGERYSYISHSF